MSLDFFGAVTGIFVVVYDGQHALRFTLGRARGVVGPGVHFKWPIIQKFKVEETKHTTLNLEPQVIQLNDDLVYEVDCKVMYQIVDLRKAIVEIDDLETGLQNRVVMAVQRVVQAQNRQTVLDTNAMAEQVRQELRVIEDQWGVRILQFGFSNISPSPASLEITQLELLADERLELYKRFRKEGLAQEAAVALLTGAVVTTGPTEQGPSLAERTWESELIEERAAEAFEEAEARRKRKRAAEHEQDPDSEPLEDDEADEDL